MSFGLFIDPGVHRHACAWFTPIGDLDSVEFRHALEGFRGVGWEGTATTIEKMEIYASRGAEDPNDLLDVHGAACRAAEAIEAGGGAPVVWVKPREWKGQAKKWQHHNRIWGVLRPVERARFAAGAGLEVDFITKKLDDACQRWARGEVTKRGKVKGYEWDAHNLFDAVGLGLWHHGRIGLNRARLSRVAKV
jgi:hypothetical protein